MRYPSSVRHPSLSECLWYLSADDYRSSGYTWLIIDHTPEGDGTQWSVINPSLSSLAAHGSILQQTCNQHHLPALRCSQHPFLTAHYKKISPAFEATKWERLITHFQPSAPWMLALCSLFASLPQLVSGICWLNTQLWSGRFVTLFRWRIAFIFLITWIVSVCPVNRLSFVRRKIESSFSLFKLQTNSSLHFQVDRIASNTCSIFSLIRIYCWFLNVKVCLSFLLIISRNSGFYLLGTWYLWLSLTDTDYSVHVNHMQDTSSVISLLINCHSRISSNFLVCGQSGFLKFQRISAASPDMPSRWGWLLSPLLFCSIEVPRWGQCIDCMHFWCFSWRWFVWDDELQSGLWSGTIRKRFKGVGRPFDCQLQKASQNYFNGRLYEGDGSSPWGQNASLTCGRWLIRPPTSRFFSSRLWCSLFCP